MDSSERRRNDGRNFSFFRTYVCFGANFEEYNEKNKSKAEKMKTEKRFLRCQRKNMCCTILREKTMKSD